MNTFIIKAPECVSISVEMFQTLSLMSKSENKLKVKGNDQGLTSINGVVNTPVGGNWRQYI